MFSDFVRNFTITCPECKTSVTFSIDMDNTHALYIRAYNDALSELQNAAEQNHVKLS